MIGKKYNISVISAIQDTPQKMIQAILDEAPPKFALAGHSMGGWLCLEIMRVAPSRVSKLCLLNTTKEMDSGHMSPIEMPQAISALLRFWLTYF